MNSFLITLYTIIPKLFGITVCAEGEYNPFQSCDFSTAEGVASCEQNLLLPDWDWWHPIQSFNDQLLYWIAQVLIRAINLGSANLFEHSLSVSNGVITTTWTYQEIGAIVEIFRMVAMVACFFGLVVAFAEMGIQYSNDQGNIVSTVVNVGKGIAFTFLYAFVMTELFSIIVDFGSTLSATILFGGIGNGGNGSGWLGAVASLTAIISIITLFFSQPLILFLIVIVFLVLYLKYIYELLKRAAIYLILICEGSYLSFNLCRGYGGQIQSYLSKVVSFLIGCVLQVAFFAIGVNFLTNAASYAIDEGTHLFTNLMAGFVFMSISSKVYNYLGTAAPIPGDAFSKASTFLHFADHANSITNGKNNFISQTANYMSGGSGNSGATTVAAVAQKAVRTGIKIGTGGVG